MGTWYYGAKFKKKNILNTPEHLPVTGGSIYRRYEHLAKIIFEILNQSLEVCRCQISVDQAFFFFFFFLIFTPHGSFEINRRRETVFPTTKSRETSGQRLSKRRLKLEILASYASVCYAAGEACLETLIQCQDKSVNTKLSYIYECNWVLQQRVNTDK